MPVPDEVIDAWMCTPWPAPDAPQCTPVWISCDECDGEPGPDDKCGTCTGSGGGYICGTHDIEPPNVK